MEKTDGVESFTQFTKINSRVIKVLSLKNKSLNILVKSISEYLLDLGLEKGYLSSKKV